MYSNAFIGDYYLQDLYDIRTETPIERTFNYMPVNLIPMARPSHYKIGLKTFRDDLNMQAFMPQSYYQDLEFARNENAQLRKKLEEITQTQIWKAMQPIRELTKRIRSKR
jgi:hypothetical protein